MNVAEWSWCLLQGSVSRNVMRFKAAKDQSFLIFQQSLPLLVTATASLTHSSLNVTNPMLLEGGEEEGIMHLVNQWNAKQCKKEKLLCQVSVNTDATGSGVGDNTLFNAVLLELHLINYYQIKHQMFFQRCCYSLQYCWVWKCWETSRGDCMMLL